MPNKTIYVSDDDLPLFQRAQELAGGKLSTAITAALRRYVEIAEGRMEGFEEVTVRVGAGVGRKVRFSGILLAEWGHSTSSRVDDYRVYRTRTGKYAVHIERSDEHYWSGQDAANWVEWVRAQFKTEQTWGYKAGEGVLEIAEDLEDLRDKIPAELHDIVASAVEQPPIEDLDI
ncbi:EXLDI protein [Stackebrandtia nassauensis]|uniref:EXLDI protein n=1 Tax=Stackebrandtia nassauensis (strain DSM 44728 / CIP 108903 / NRRL B-16338 / NBRC 102104 / LLR-40K-21) TaxID=446470 RepID=D3PWZ6_STANL|nr:EXLDI protein [Stackebrandtia nassauensis]ADD45220.1 hypothetical protein Snas_5590 [Stackebrandtia nassauensis DSM 44728]